MNNYHLTGKVVDLKIKDNFILVEDFFNEKNVIAIHFNNEEEIKDLKINNLYIISFYLETKKSINNGIIEYETYVYFKNYKLIHNFSDNEEDFF